MPMNVAFRLISLSDAEQLQANCMPGATEVFFHKPLEHAGGGNVEVTR